MTVLVRQDIYFLESLQNVNFKVTTEIILVYFWFKMSNSVQILQNLNYYS